VARAATALVLVVVALSSVAEAGSPKALGAAYAAYDRGDLEGARRQLARVGKVVNRDYELWLRGMVALRLGRHAEARKAFEALGKLGGSKFAGEVPWRLADVAWERGDRAGAAKAYARLVAAKGSIDAGDIGTAMFRIAESKTGGAALAAYRAFVIAHPAHPLAARAERTLAERGAPELTDAERIDRAKRMTAQHLWDESIAEMSQLEPSKLPASLKLQRDYWFATTLFKMRRRYDEASVLLLDVYPKLDSAEAMFHGARALSRADRDDEAIVWYHKVVARYPRSSWAQEAQFLSGWLEFNRGRYAKAIAPLEDCLRR